MFSFLRYYVRLRVEVLLGRRTAGGPLGLRYRWRYWRYTQHLKRLKERSWQSEAVKERKSPGGNVGEATAKGGAEVGDGGETRGPYAVRCVQAECSRCGFVAASTLAWELK